MTARYWTENYQLYHKFADHNPWTDFDRMYPKLSYVTGNLLSEICTWSFINVEEKAYYGKIWEMPTKKHFKRMKVTWYEGHMRWRSHKMKVMWVIVVYPLLEVIFQVHILAERLTQNHSAGLDPRCPLTIWHFTQICALTVHRLVKVARCFHWSQQGPRYEGTIVYHGSPSQTFYMRPGSHLIWYVMSRLFSTTSEHPHNAFTSANPTGSF